MSSISVTAQILHLFATRTASLDPLDPYSLGINAVPGARLEIYSGILCVLMPSEILERRSPPQGCVCLLTDPLIDKLDVLDRLLEVSSVHLVTRFSAFIGRRMAERGIS